MCARPRAPPPLPARHRWPRGQAAQQRARRRRLERKLQALAPRQRPEAASRPRALPQQRKSQNCVSIVLPARCIKKLAECAKISVPGQEYPFRVSNATLRRRRRQSYFGGAGVKPSRLWLGSGLGLGLGAFLTSFLPLSLLPMRVSVPQKSGFGKEGKTESQAGASVFLTAGRH
jgi:hypothetical protein